MVLYMMVYIQWMNSILIPLITCKQYLGDQRPLKTELRKMHLLCCLLYTTKYYDVLERTLYNGLISGVSLDGGGFFYPNPLESIGQHQRQPWFGEYHGFTVSDNPYIYFRFNRKIQFHKRQDPLYKYLFIS